MSNETPTPGAGLARRRRRLSDEETERRMLTAAMAMVNEAGLTVSLDHISFEDVIREAGVSRSAVYRRWPYKDLFFSDLLIELAGDASPAIVGDNPDAVRAINQILLDHLDWLDKPELRRALAGEALRQGALNEFETFRNSPTWRTYFALNATFRSLPDGALRDQVQLALTASERSLVSRLAQVYEQVTSLIGLRLRPELNLTFETVAGVASATIRGLVLTAPANPDIATQRFTANPFGAPEPAEWSPPALAMTSVVLTYVEPDPTIEWDDTRTTVVHQILTADGWAGP